MMSIFSPWLTDHRLDAAAAHADAGAWRSIEDHGAHRDLGAAAGIAGDRHHLDDAIIDLGHLLAEQLGHSADGCAAGRSAARAARDGHRKYRRAPGRRCGSSPRQALVATDDGLAAAEINDDVAIFDALHHTRHDLADAVLVFVASVPLALGSADLPGRSPAWRSGRRCGRNRWAAAARR